MRKNSFINGKPQAANLGSNQNNNFAGGINKGFDVFNYKKNTASGQCRNCGSDDNRFAIDSICIRCQQKVEYIVREHPGVLKNLNHVPLVSGGANERFR
jgi:hypothetical protein